MTRFSRSPCLLKGVIVAIDRQLAGQRDCVTVQPAPAHAYVTGVGGIWRIEPMSTRLQNTGESHINRRIIKEGSGLNI